MNPEELYLKTYTRYGDIAFDELEDEREEEYDAMEEAEALWDGRDA